MMDAGLRTEMPPGAEPAMLHPRPSLPAARVTEASDAGKMSVLAADNADVSAVSRPLQLPFEQPILPLSSSLYHACKCAIDFGLALLLGVLLLPVALTAMLLIKLTSRGPALYTQTRLGKNGQPFTIYKLRTMTHKCESLTGACWSMPGDTRITPLGRLLRRSHIDELPQLWNVLCGHMSLVGPRPERPEFVPQLEQAIPQYRSRLLMKPGVTGLAQVQLPPDTNLASVRLKLAFDLYYVRHASLWLDLRIVLSTALKMVGVPFGVLRKLFWFPSMATVEQKSGIRG
jgi:lipopolysaccharide/colanic/teichoic acid biosynthesis glycosyltransferase